jgi:hypothetical protein
VTAVATLFLLGPSPFTVRATLGYFLGVAAMTLALYVSCSTSMVVTLRRH